MIAADEVRISSGLSVDLSARLGATAPTSR